MLYMLLLLYFLYFRFLYNSSSKHNLTLYVVIIIFFCISFDFFIFYLNLPRQYDILCTRGTRKEEEK